MSLLLINCYFGSLPNYFELWMKSCEANPEIDFLLVTDANICRTPHNINVVKITWEQLVENIQRKFEFRIKLQSPYKLTDFKPAYGYIFEDYVGLYDYWGYCDIDLIFGNLMKFIKKPMEDNVDKIYRLGHLTIYRNNEKMRNLFQKSGSMFSYRKVFSNKEFYSFDEHSGMIMISMKQGVNEFYREDMADISCRMKRLTASRHKNYSHQLFFYENGSVYRAFVSNDTVKTEEFAYIHMQKRRFKSCDVDSAFYIKSDSFVSKKMGIPTINEIIENSEFISDETDYEQVKKYRNKKKKDFYKCTIKKKIIWIKIKIAELYTSRKIIEQF